MTREIYYTWKLRDLMSSNQMYSTTDLAPLLKERGIQLSQSQIYRLVSERPERIAVKTLLALMDAFDCTFEDLMEVSVTDSTARKTASEDWAADQTGSSHAIGQNRPKRARINLD